MTPDETASVVAMLKAHYSWHQVSEQSVALYAAFLADVELELGVRAVARWIATEPKFPYVSDLRAAVDRERGIAAPDIDQAWSEVNAAMRNVGSRGLPSFSHRAVRLAVEAVGWANLCASRSSSFDREHFARAYKAAVRRCTSSSSDKLVAALAAPLTAIARGERMGALPAPRDDREYRREVMAEPLPPAPTAPARKGRSR